MDRPTQEPIAIPLGVADCAFVVGLAEIQEVPRDGARFPGQDGGHPDFDTHLCVAEGDNSQQRPDWGVLGHVLDEIVGSYQVHKES